LKSTKLSQVRFHLGNLLEAKGKLRARGVEPPVVSDGRRDTCVSVERLYASQSIDQSTNKYIINLV
jgi:hypothetical protein